MAISAQQRAWLEDLGALVGAPVQVEEGGAQGDSPRSTRGASTRLRLSKQALVADGDEGTVEKDSPEGDGGGQRFGFGPEDILPVIPDLIDEVTTRRATCAIHNNTQQVLRLDTASLDETDDDSGKTPGIRHGKYVRFPPSQVSAGDESGRFVAENNKVGPLSTTGAEGFLKYILDPQGTAWIVHFNNPFGATGDTKSADARVEGPNAQQFETPKPGISGKFDARYLFILNAKGGTPPTPVPVPPTPAANMPSSCLITVTNNTKVPLVFMNAEHERGNFMTPVPNTVAPGTAVTIASVETPNAKEQGCKGLIIWQVGTSSGGAVWTIFWDNPEGEKNTSKTDFIPQPDASPETAFSTTDQIGQGDENVPAQFTISGGGAATPIPPTPIPPTPVPPTPEPAFEPPVESKQPTLRKGDGREDGWVEYAQLLLNHHLGTSLPEDGNFDAAMLAAVKKFQTKEKLLVDGVIGNQTWAALREGAPEKPSTDGRKPHEFVERGAEARWAKESSDNNRHFASDDFFRLLIQTVGDTPLDPNAEATLRVTAPGASPKTVRAKIIARQSGSLTHRVELNNFRKTFPSIPVDAPITKYLVEAFLPQELGGDFYSAKVKEGSEATR